jgi:hypothetical protein
LSGTVKGSSDVDDHLEFRGLLHGKVAGLLTAQDAADIACGLSEQLRDMDAIGQETALVGKGAHRCDKRQPVAGRQLDDTLAMAHREWVRRHEQRTTRLSRKPRDTRLDLRDIAHRHIQYVERELFGR